MTRWVRLALNAFLLVVFLFVLSACNDFIVMDHESCTYTERT
jgi:hypothetical protein